MCNLYRTTEVDCTLYTVPTSRCLRSDASVRVTNIVACLQCMPMLCTHRQSDSSCGLKLKPAPPRARASAPAEEASGSAGASQGSQSMRPYVCSALVRPAAPLSDPSSEGMLTDAVDDDVLSRAIMQHLPGCYIHETLGAGGVSACFAAVPVNNTEVAIKVTRKGYLTAGTNIEAFAEVRNLAHCLPNKQAEGMLIRGDSVPPHRVLSPRHNACPLPL